MPCVHDSTARNRNTPTDVTSTRSAFSPAWSVAETVVVMPTVTSTVWPFLRAKVSAIPLSGAAIEPVSITFNSAAAAASPAHSSATTSAITRP